MKTQTKKILMGLGIALLGSFAAKAQGLQNIIVEKYYQVNAADVSNAAAAASAASNTLSLAPGAICYRVYADLAPGYELNSMYAANSGTVNHAWKITTTTTFFNTPDIDTKIGNALVPTGSGIFGLRLGTRMIDSYLTVGEAAAGRAGITKALDGDGSIGNTSGSVLANNPGGSFGLPITGSGSADGIVVGTAGTNFQSSGYTVLGSASSAANIFDAASAASSGPGGTFSITGGAIAVLGGVVGTTTDNIVLLGQFTTDGVFGFELNVQVQNTLTGTPENWVAKDVQFGEFTLPALTLAPPTVTITSPLNGANVVTNSTVNITAGAAATGTVTQVEFFVNGSSIGVDATSPFAAAYPANTNGAFTITAVATDNTSLTATSAPVVINVAANQVPVVSVAAPAGLINPAIATFTANAVDPDGTIASVSFSVDNVAIGTTTVGGPAYTFTWVSTSGVHNVRASAIDNLGATGLSVPVNFTITANQSPVVNITAPTSGTIISGATVAVTIDATATDADGVITQVQAFVNNTLVGTYNAAAPNYTFTYNTSTLTTVDIIRVVATDDAANTTTAQVNINISNPNGDPYLIDRVAQRCNEGLFSLPVKSTSSYTVDNVIGYDFVVAYNSTSLTPTGNFSVNPASVANYVASGTFSTSIGYLADYTTTPGTMSVSIFFNPVGNASTIIAQPYFFANSPLGQDLFFIGFQKLIMSNNDSTNISIVGGSIQESYVTGINNPLITTGKYVTFRETIFQSRLYNYIDLSPVGTNTAVSSLIYGTNGTLATSPVSSVVATASVNGRFDYNVLNGNNVRIRRDVASLTDVQSVVNGFDANRGKLVLGNSATFLPSVSQMIALDVNMDGVISAGDVTQINRRAVLQIPEFQQAWNYNAAGTNTLAATLGTLPAWFADSKDWQFIDSILVDATAAASYTPYAGIYQKYQRSNSYPAPGTNNGFWKNNVPVVPFSWAVPQTSVATGPNANCPTIDDRGYLGIFVGDADGSYTTTTGSFAGRNASNSNKIVLDLANSIVTGNSIDVPVSFVSSSAVYAVDFSLKYEENNMTFNQMVNYPNSTDVLAFQNQNDKVLRFTSSKANAGTYNADQPVASIRFDLKQGAISPEQFSSLNGYLNGQPVALEVSSKSVGINSLGGNDAVSVYPNPTNGLLNITSANDATIQMFDISGRELLLESSVSASKTQQINVSGLLNGVYILKVTSNNYTTVKKVVLSK